MLEKGGQGATEGRVGAADITLLLIAAKRRGQAWLMGYSFSPEWFELSHSHSSHSAGK